MIRIMNRISILIPFMASMLTHAADLKAPIDLSSAKVLPKGVRNIRYKGVLAEGNEKYNSSGDVKVIADPFFKKINWRDLTDPKVDPTGKGLLEGYLKANDYNLNENVGETTGAVSVSAWAHVPVLAYGLSEKITLGAALPIVKYRFNVNTGFISNNSMQKLANQLKADGKTFELAELQEKMHDPVGTKLKDFNYQPLRNEEGTKLGDLKFISKYLLMGNESYTLSIQGEVTAPTGEKPDINKVVDVAPGDGQWDVGLTFLNDWAPTDRMTLVAAFNYTAQLPDHTAKRVPYRSDSTLSPDIDNNVDRDLGDTMMAQVGGKYDTPIHVILSTGMTFQMKEKDSYSGNAFSPARYEWMEADTRQRMLTGQIGAGYSTVRMFREKSFPVPLEFNLNHSFLLSGSKNVTRDAVSSLEFVMFF